MPAALRYVLGSHNYLWVYRLLDPVTGKPVVTASANIKPTIYDVDGVTPIWGEGSSLLWPAFEYVPNTKADYRCVLPPDLPVLAAKYYMVTITITINGLVRVLEGTMFVVTEDY
jgi:hypothetical protein